ncbi:hypothetical protein C8J56DRAFT_772826, partial [Mycena floridula]
IPGLEIAQVCSSWRSISFSNPSLWSAIDISSWGFAKPKHWSRAVEFLLEKSGQAPLFIKIAGLEESDEIYDVLWMLAEEFYLWMLVLGWT